MPDDNIRPIRPPAASRDDPADAAIVYDIIAQIAASDGIEALERTLASALDYVRLTRAKRDRARFGESER